MSIYDAAMRYRADGVPLVVLAGREYGSGSSRDWAAKGPALLGVRAVIAESFERIHRSNLVGMGILPLQFTDGTTIASLGLTGEETFDIVGLDAIRSGDVPKEITVRAGDVEFSARVRIDTPMEAEYFRHGGILPYVLRQLAALTGSAPQPRHRRRSPSHSSPDCGDRSAPILVPRSGAADRRRRGGRRGRRSLRRATGASRRPLPRTASVVVTAPVYDHDAPDPDIIRVGSTYYVYTTGSHLGNIPVLTSTDLQHWTPAR